MSLPTQPPYTQPSQAPLAPGPAPKKHWGLRITLIILLALVLMGAGGVFSWWYFTGRDDHPTPTPTSSGLPASGQPTGRFVSFAERHVATPISEDNGYSGVEVHLVGFTADGGEIELYHMRGFQNEFLASGDTLYVLDTSVEPARVYSMNYGSEADEYPLTLRAQLPDYPWGGFTVMNDTAYYVLELQSNELHSMDLHTGIENPPLVIDLTQSHHWPDGNPHIDVLEATDDRLIFTLNDDVCHVFDPLTQESTIMCEGCRTEVILAHQVIYTKPRETVDDGWDQEFFEYDVRTGVTTQIGIPVTDWRMEGTIITPFHEGYVYLDSNMSAQETPVHDVYYVSSPRSQPQLVMTQPYGRGSSFFPMSQDSILLSGIQADLSEDETNYSYTLIAFETDGTILGTSTGDRGYFNPQYPRYPN